MEPRIAVLGAGSVGLAVTGVLVLSGFDVSLAELPTFSSALQPLSEHGRIRVQGGYGAGFAKPAITTTDMKKAIAGRQILLFCMPAYGHEPFTRACAPYLEDGQILVYLSCFGAMRMARLISELGVKADVSACETMSCFYLASKTGPSEVIVKRKKEGLLFAAFPGKKTEKSLSVVKKLFPDLVPAKNCLETSINNTNPWLHPTSSVMNAGWIEATDGGFNFVKEGFTPSVIRLQHAADREKMQITQALGLVTRSCDEWIRKMYTFKDISSLRTDAQTKKEYPKDAPKNLASHRYMLEDVAYGLVPVTSIGHELGIQTPVIDAVVELSSIVAENEFWKTGVTAEALGLHGLSKEGMNSFAETGT